ncbi:MAG TPA: zinc-ribbon domain-containing protein [Myxococcales bacterium]|jgi:predicted Zn finger-like uncharacterized protein
MRVTCDKCKAVYAVDDKLIGPKGARAQCPKCKTLQIVKRPPEMGGAAASPLPPSPAASPAAGPRSSVASAPIMAPRPMSASSAVDDLLGMVAEKPAGTPAAQASDPFAGIDLGGGPADSLLGLGPAAKPGAGPLIDPFAAIQSGPSATPAPGAGLFDLMPSRPGAGPAGLDPFGPPSGKPAATLPDPFGPPPAKSAALPDPFGPPPPAARKPTPARPSAGDPFGFGPPAPAAAPRPASSAPAWPPSAPAAAPASPAGGFEDLFGPKPTAAPAGDPFAGPPAAGPVANCRTCHKPIPDPFDAALGVCESCRNKEQQQQQQPIAKAAAKPTGQASAFGPPEVPPTSEIEFAERPAAPAARPANRSGSAARAPSGSGGLGKWIGLLLVLAIAGGGGYVWFTKPAALFKRPKPKPLPAIENRLTEWTMAGMGTTGTAAEHYERARKAFLVDKPTSYLEAEEEFKASIVADPESLKAVAGYVEAFAIGRAARAPEPAVAEARELISAVLSKQPGLAVAHRARANLFTALNQSEDARKEAEEALALSGPDEKAEALLTLGCTYLRKSAPIALEKVDAALAKDKTLKRAYLYRGLANEYAGKYAAAVADFNERLKLDPDQREALGAQARVYAKLGDFKSARTALATFASKHPNVGEPRVMLVQLAYAAERDLPLAEKTLKELKGDEARFDDQDKLELATLWAAVARERGDLKTSFARADEALKIDPTWGPAHFQKMLSHLAANDAEKARAELRAVENKIDDPYRVKEYLGRIEAAAGNADAAIAAFREAADRAPSKVTPRLNIAALLVKKGELDMAWSTMRKALDADPTSISQIRRQVGDYFEPPVDAIKGLHKAFEINSDEVNWLPRSYAAVALFHAGEMDRAQAGLDKVLASDPTSLASLLYRAQIEVDRKRFDQAFKFADRAMKAERQSAVAFYLAGRALEGQKKTEHARQMYLSALDRNPSLVPANVRLGMISTDEDKEGAKQSLLNALTVDPENLDARVALFRLGY